MTGAAFLDLNGTLVMPVRATHPREYALLPMAAAAVRLLNRAGFVCPVVTVQSRIGKGLYSAADFLSWFSRFRAGLGAEGAMVEGPYLCPHWREDRCACKKPRTLLYREAADDLGIDLARSVVIGDTAADVLAAKELGCPGCLVRTGWGEAAILRDRADELADYVAADVLGAARWVIAEAARGGVR